MKNIEEQLARAELRAADGVQRARMTALFDAAMPSRRFGARSIPLWQCAAACVVCLAAGYLLAGAERGETNPKSPPRVLSPSSTAAPANPTAQVNLVRQREDGWIEITVLETSS